jgi:hypothetical protein
MSGRIEIIARTEQHDIGLQLAIFRRELDRVLDIDDIPVTVPAW